MAQPTTKHWTAVHTTYVWLVLILATIYGCGLPMVDGVRIHPSEVPVLQNLQAVWRRTFAGWSNNTDCSAAVGLKCNAQGRIISLRLANTELNGNIPQSLSVLLRLTNLDMQGNTLTGSIPASFSTLTNLQNLDMQGNKLTGSIPASFSTLTNLQNLNLGDNHFTGTMLASLATLTALNWLALYGNRLNGSIPDSISVLRGLTFLDMQRNQLKGSIPGSFSALTNLQSLKLNDNQLAGSIPESLGSLPALQYIDLDSNQLTGNIPASLGALTSLQYLWLYNNRFTGTIPASFAALTALRYLSLGYNKLTGTIPSSLGALTALDRLWLYKNRFTGTIPASFAALTALRYLDLDSNQLTGNIPASLGALISLQYLYIQRNQLTGSIPASFSALTNLQDLFLGYNQLTGTIPASLAAFTALNRLGLYGNQLNGSIPDSISVLRGLVFLSLFSNELTGNIPSFIGTLTDLQILSLGYNKLTGTIPSSLGALTALDTLGLYGNQLTGSIPDSISALRGLTVLALDSNQLQGSIPSSLSSLVHLLYLSLQVNQLTGSIPDTLSSLQNLTTLILSSNQIMGTIPSQLGKLTNLIFLDLSQNFLGGAVPGSLGNLQKLTLLNLGGGYGTSRCPDSRSLCWVDPKTDAFQQSLFCTQNCPLFCSNCVPGVPNFTESQGFEAKLKLLNGKRNPYFRYASLLSSPRQPPFIDWRLSGHVFSIKDQLNCSSCWAFSAIAVVESAIAISCDRQAVSLSEQQILDCISTPGIDCSGGLAEVALDYFANITASISAAGVLPADFYPYRASTGACNGMVQTMMPTPTTVTMYEEVDYFGWIGIMLAVQNQPVIANLHGSYPSFLHYDGKAYIYGDETCAQGVVDHSVVIVGYNLTSRPPYWIIRNSAGPSWGRGGYMNIRIVKGNGICDIQSSPVLYPVITLASLCKSPLQPCGAGVCLDDGNEPKRPGRNRCLCPAGFINITNLDWSTSCAPVDACNFYSRSPCGVGTCVNDNSGGYTCICPVGYILGRMASDSSATCVPAVLSIFKNLTYVVKVNGLTCLTLAAAYGLTNEQLRQDNRQLTDAVCLNLPLSTRINITLSRLRDNCNVRYSWSKGDTCALVSNLAHVPLARLKLLNPWLNCTKLRFPSPGQQLCLNVSSVGEPNGTLPRCSMHVAVNGSDTCASIIEKFRLPPLKFFGLNPGLFCDSIGAQSNHSAALPPVDEVCVDGSMQGVQQCSHGFSPYKVTARDRCIRLVSLFFGGKPWRMSAANGAWLCRDKDLYNGRVICVPCIGAACPRAPPPLPKKAAIGA